MKNNRIECGQLIVLLCALFIARAAADPFNGSFELFEPNQSTNFNEPNGWQTENYVTVSNGFLPSSFAGDQKNWRINTQEVFPAFKGEHLLVLSTGPQGIGISVASQQVNIQEGDRITGVYFFGACDYSPFDDFAKIKLVSGNPEIGEIILAETSIEMLGDYGSFANWKRFERTFDAEEVGDYNLILMVSDGLDTQLESYLVVDAITICRNNGIDPQALAGDLNCDCTVNFDDFIKFADDWGLDCSQLASTDPNCNCLLGTDFDKNGPVDYNDMQILYENWLFGVKQE